MFAAVAKEAYDLGAEYIYRVNDDTELATPWARKFSDALLVSQRRHILGAFGILGFLRSVCNQSPAIAEDLPLQLFRNSIPRVLSTQDIPHCEWMV